MSLPLTRVDDVLRPVLAGLRPAPPRRLAPHDALGLCLAAPIVAPAAWPKQSTALRAGLAVRSLDLVGACAGSPAILTGRPRPVAFSDAMPETCDAVIDSSALTAHGSFFEVAESVEPGAHVRFAGHDLRAGAVLAAQGERITPELALACALAGIDEVAIAAPTCALAGLAPSPERRWLERMLGRLGCRLTDDAKAALLLGTSDPGAPPRLALRPGETGWIALREGRVTIEIPPRFEGCVAVFAALILPVVARMTETELARREAVLSRKIASRVGVTELALLRRNGGTAEPLGVGELTLVHLARADAFMFLPPDLEGHGAGDRVSLTPFDSPLSGTRP